jgi:hypothetical protein
VRDRDRKCVRESEIELEFSRKGKFDVAGFEGTKKLSLSFEF